VLGGGSILSPRGKEEGEKEGTANTRTASPVSMEEGKRGGDYWRGLRIADVLAVPFSGGRGEEER